MDIEKAYRQAQEQKRLAQLAAKSGGGFAVAAGGFLSGGSITGVPLTSSIGVATTGPGELMRTQMELEAVRCRLAYAERRAATYERERHELADKLDEATQENERIAARLHGVVQMLRDEDSKKLDEAIWLLDKIAADWDARAKPKGSDDDGQKREQVIEEYFDHWSGQVRRRVVDPPF